jgi:hypothetical protein
MSKGSEWDVSSITNFNRKYLDPLKIDKSGWGGFDGTAPRFLERDRYLKKQKESPSPSKYAGLNSKDYRGGSFT